MEHGHATMWVPERGSHEAMRRYLEQKRPEYEKYREVIEESKPEQLREQRIRLAAFLRHRLDEEPSPEMVDDFLLEGLRRSTEPALARLSEITSEEKRRIISEERARLDEGNGVDEEAVVDAAVDRLSREYPYLYEKSGRASSPRPRE